MFKWFFARPYIYSVIAIAVIAGGSFYFFGNSGDAELETVTVSRGEIREEVTLSGKVKPAESVELGFEKGGRISKVGAAIGSRVAEGQVLAEVYSGDLASQLVEAQANLKSERAELDDLKKGAREEDIDIAKEKVNDAKQNLFDKIEDAYTKADDAIHNKVDQFFSNPGSTNPQLEFRVSSQLEADLETSRVLLVARFKAWQDLLIKMKVDDNLYPFAAETAEHLRNIKSFLDTVAVAINGLGTDSGLTEATITTYRGDVSTARTNVNTAINNVSGAVSALKIAESELAKELAGSTEEEIIVQESSVEKAQASVNNILAQISKTRITSPIRGVVTKQDAKIGQIVAASTPVVSIISDAQFEIEGNLPEVDVSKVKIGDEARVTLDAYGDTIFEAKVISVDPAETVIEGVSTYKVNLAFLEEDERIKSGLSANIDIVTERKADALFVPERAIITRDGKKFIRIQNPDGRADEIEVTLGLRGYDGRVEVLSGLAEGVRVIISPDIM